MWRNIFYKLSQAKHTQPDSSTSLLVSNNETDMLSTIVVENPESKQAIAPQSIQNIMRQRRLQEIEKKFVRDDLKESIFKSTDIMETIFKYCSVVEIFRSAGVNRNFYESQNKHIDLWFRNYPEAFIAYNNYKTMCRYFQKLETEADRCSIKKVFTGMVIQSGHTGVTGGSAAGLGWGTYKLASWTKKAGEICVNSITCCTYNCACTPDPDYVAYCASSCSCCCKTCRDGNSSFLNTCAGTPLLAVTTGVVGTVTLVVGAAAFCPVGIFSTNASAPGSECFLPPYLQTTSVNRKLIEENKEKLQQFEIERVALEPEIQPFPLPPRAQPIVSQITPQAVLPMNCCGSVNNIKSDVSQYIRHNKEIVVGYLNNVHNHYLLESKEVITKSSSRLS